MSKGKKLLVVAEELQEMVVVERNHFFRTGQTELEQACHGVDVTLSNAVMQLKQMLEIENGNS